MAARRERDRRRPNGERRYRFTTPEPELEPDETLSAVEADGEASETAEAAPAAPKSRPARATTSTTLAQAKPARTAKPFSAYKDEYAYVYGDLRRVGVVIGSLLAALIVLYFVLPLLVH
jgi:hypothetical protein